MANFDETTAHGKKMYTNCICVGCGFGNCYGPLIASQVKCCCIEASAKIDPSLCKEGKDACKGHIGTKLGPLVVDVKNPLIDHDELVVLLTIVFGLVEECLQEKAGRVWQ